MSFSLLRKRQPSEPVASGAIVRIAQGDFGNGSPWAGLAAVDPRASAAIYNYHEGDLFTPGSGNYVFEPIFELPLITVWGRAFLRMPRVFNPIQPPQVWVQSTVNPNGIGGIVAGDMELQGLINPDGTLAPSAGFDYDGYDK